eukprot:scaffold60075_cov50-Phaeocystis_antarctica.AAC.1
MAWRKGLFLKRPVARRGRSRGPRESFAPCDAEPEVKRYSAISGQKSVSVGDELRAAGGAVGGALLTLTLLPFEGKLTCPTATCNSRSIEGEITSRSGCRRRCARRWRRGRSCACSTRWRRTHRRRSPRPRGLANPRVPSLPAASASQRTSAVRPLRFPLFAQRARVSIENLHSRDVDESGKTCSRRARDAGTWPHASARLQLCLHRSPLHPTPLTP